MPRFLTLTLALSAFTTAIVPELPASPNDARILGKGGKNVCVSTDRSAFSGRSYIARESTETDASTTSWNECLREGGPGSRCSRPVCMEDPGNSSVTPAKVVLKVGDTRIDLSVPAMHLGAQCLAKDESAFSGRLYSAKAGTRLEAQALALNACIEDGGFSNRCELRSCLEISEGAPVPPAPSPL